MSLIGLSLSEAAEKLNDGSVTSVELCEALLARVDEVEDKVGALVSIDKEAVLASAQASDERRAAGNAIGEYDGDFDDVTPGAQDKYTFVSLTLEHEGFYGTLGSFSQDADGEYLELGYGTTVSEIDLGVALILANDDLIGTDDESLLFSVGKSFDLN